jgi:hypothetical protein
MKQTSIEWLFEKLWEHQKDKLTWHSILNKAKEMEKQQITDAHIEGQRVFDKHPHTQWTNNQAEQYYNETYGSKGSDDSPKVENKDIFGEISDEEIEKFASDYYDNNGADDFIIMGAKWYREQLKQRQ